MLKKVITYEDFNGETRTETFYFNFTQAEIAELEFSVNGGLSKYIERIVEEKDNVQLVKFFKEIILLSYGEKSPDGKRFIKSPEIREEFSQTNAYSTLFLELAQNAESAAAFINGVIPTELSNSISN